MCWLIMMIDELVKIKALMRQTNGEPWLIMVNNGYSAGESSWVIVVGNDG